MCIFRGVFRKVRLLLRNILTWPTVKYTSITTEEMSVFYKWNTSICTDVVAGVATETVWIQRMWSTCIRTNHLLSGSFSSDSDTYKSQDYKKQIILKAMYITKD